LTGRRDLVSPLKNNVRDCELTTTGQGSIFSVGDLPAVDTPQFGCARSRLPHRAQPVSADLTGRRSPDDPRDGTRRASAVAGGPLDARRSPGEDAPTCACRPRGPRLDDRYGHRRPRRLVGGGGVRPEHDRSRGIAGELGTFRRPCSHRLREDEPSSAL